MIQLINEQGEGGNVFGVRGYATEEERAQGIEELRARGITNVVCYQDAKAPFAVLYRKP